MTVLLEESILVTCVDDEKEMGFRGCYAPCICSAFLQLSSKYTSFLSCEKKLWFLRFEVFTSVFQKIESAGMLCSAVR
jgi:hypothetical protein